MYIQSHLPVIIDTTLSVVGSIPLYVSVGWVGNETTIVLGGTPVPLAWMYRDTVYNEKRKIAYVPITQSDFRQGRFPVYFRRNPDFYFPAFHAERDVLHWGAPPIPDYWMWLFTHGATMIPELPDPGIESETPHWTMEVPMLSSADCAFVDLDWTQFAPAGVPATGITFSGFPLFMQAALISEDPSQAMAGLTQAEATPVMRIYRVNAPTAGTFSIPMTLHSKDADFEFILDIVVA
jgi:hypothetical protein